jgi:type IV pilus assembly protein PilV
MSVAVGIAFVAPARRCGFTLVEALIALCVVMLGLGGAATLQLQAQRTVFNAAHLSDGVLVAAALAERMRANPVALALDDARNPYLQFDYDAAGGPPAPAGHCYAGAGCAPDALAAADVYETALAVAAGFPHGRVLACRDGAAAEPASWTCDGRAGAPLVIKLGWSMDGGPAAPAVLLPVDAP